MAIRVFFPCACILSVWRSMLPKRVVRLHCYRRRPFTAGSFSPAWNVPLSGSTCCHVNISKTNAGERTCHDWSTCKPTCFPNLSNSSHRPLHYFRLPEQVCWRCASFPQVGFGGQNQPSRLHGYNVSLTSSDHDPMISARCFQ